MEDEREAGDCGRASSSSLWLSFSSASESAQLSMLAGVSSSMSLVSSALHVLELLLLLLLVESFVLTWAVFCDSGLFQ